MQSHTFAMRMQFIYTISHSPINPLKHVVASIASRISIIAGHHSQSDTLKSRPIIQTTTTSIGPGPRSHARRSHKHSPYIGAMKALLNYHTILAGSSNPHGAPHFTTTKFSNNPRRLDVLDEMEMKMLSSFRDNLQRCRSQQSDFYTIRSDRRGHKTSITIFHSRNGTSYPLFSTQHSKH